MNKKTIFIETNYIVCILFPLKVKTSVCLQCICPCQVTLYRRYTDKLYILKQTPSATLCNKMTSSNKVNFQKMFLINSTEGTLVAKLFSWNVRKVSIGCDQHAHLWQLNKEYTPLDENRNSCWTWNWLVLYGNHVCHSISSIVFIDFI